MDRDAWLGYGLGAVVFLCTIGLTIGIYAVITQPPPVLPPDYSIIQNGCGEYRWMKVDQSQFGMTLFQTKDEAVRAAIAHTNEEARLVGATNWTIVETGVNTNR